MRALKNGRYVETKNGDIGIVFDMSDLRKVSVHLIDENGETVVEQVHGGESLKVLPRQPSRVAKKKEKIEE